MKYRLTWVQCPDCGRVSTAPGGCFIVERRGLFGWGPALVTYDRGGSAQAQHFPNEVAAERAWVNSRQPAAPTKRVVRELR